MTNLHTRLTTIANIYGIVDRVGADWAMTCINYGDYAEACDALESLIDNNLPELREAGHKWLREVRGALMVDGAAQAA